MIAEIVPFQGTRELASMGMIDTEHRDRIERVADRWLDLSREPKAERIRRFAEAPAGEEQAGRPASSQVPAISPPIIDPSARPSPLRLNLRQ